jgi:protein-S-isoprenylcysteine O-methyltransferase Ste14
MLPNLALATWLAADAVRVLLVARDLASEAVEIAAAVAVLCAAGLVLFRPRPIAQDVRPGTIAVALSAALLPAALSTLGPSGVPPGEAHVTVQAFAVLLMGVSIVYLGRNFSVLPQYRSLVTRGPYALVRHPIYTSYLAFDGVLAAQSASAPAATLWLAEAALLYFRAGLEERLLETADPFYAHYKARVPYRLVPLIV